ncbi:hypothetical protein A3H22_03645 [Candidatus Peribacteria bacterium RIFCSPLOWO2_12_FULL_55_15]|nr:MAG: hypothetical protein A2789_01205 [Candidatus Peribacteria bacterium RIFCSPHIGHO2_01_FULL_54_22]OGJ63731.1 MAG: hypothetical protein A3D12_03215 [Candidatus Peribacteria bacterium RIFCSPHIGHO2_02_FULL_55_24]OGJ68947.1 MAG: hypothetical protein A3H90_04040 [Candidatus Peribacteria bacterium RIFCSPLOWO2_02_FULL_55_36]OGJ70678.1 MAG: hypothetical protein A3H22_03645 [Candidatus Peribacteria bacterium RIFCSPLOWO2_12_FULL_55_15]
MPTATGDLKRLPGVVAKRIIAKMDWYIARENPFHFARRLADGALGTYRFRVGDYRVLCDVHRGKITVLEVLGVRDRKNAYRK